LRSEGTGEWALARAAARQRGLVHHSQLRAAGFSRRAIARLVARGALHPVLPRVYAVGHPALAPLAAELAALLHLEHDAVISHWSGAMLWALGAGEPGTVQATVIGRDTVPRPGLRTYRVPDLDPRDVRLRHGLPVTAPARTLIDLAAVRSADQVERALNEARVLKLVTDAELQAAMDRCPLRSGIATLRAILAAERGPAMTRSAAERRLKNLVQQAELPWPRFNTTLRRFEVDALWAEQHVVVEVDGYRFHGHRSAFERDRRRDQALVAAGYTVIRVTARQLVDEPVAVAVRIAQALARALPRAEDTAT
jgi:very-short-patch-repair endonuclease